MPPPGISECCKWVCLMKTIHPVGMLPCTPHCTRSEQFSARACRACLLIKLGLGGRDGQDEGRSCGRVLNHYLHRFGPGFQALPQHAKRTLLELSAATAGLAELCHISCVWTGYLHCSFSELAPPSWGGRASGSAKRAVLPSEQIQPKLASEWQSCFLGGGLVEVPVAPSGSLDRGARRVVLLLEP